MSLKNWVAKVCLTVLADTVANLEGLREEIRVETATGRPQGGVRVDRPESPTPSRRARSRVTSRSRSHPAGESGTRNESGPPRATTATAL